MVSFTRPGYLFRGKSGGAIPIHTTDESPVHTNKSHKMYISNSQELTFTNSNRNKTLELSSGHSIKRNDMEIKKTYPYSLLTQRNIFPPAVTVS